MANDLEIIVEDAQGNVPIKVIKLVGELNTNTSEDFQNKAKEQIDNNAEHLLLEFSELNYMSSAGLRAIHAIYQMLHDSDDDKSIGQKSDKLKLINVPENVLKVIKAVGLDVEIEIFEDHDTAVNSF